MTKYQTDCQGNFAIVMIGNASFLKAASCLALQIVIQATY